MADFPSLTEMADAAEPEEDQGQRLAGCLGALDAAAAREVATGLYATLLGLMSNFIGERMVWQLVPSARPAADATAPKDK